MVEFPSSILAGGYILELNCCYHLANSVKYSISRSKGGGGGIISLDYIIEVSLNSSDSIKLIELIWKTMIGSLERAFLLPILYLLYIVLLLLLTVK